MQSFKSYWADTKFWWRRYVRTHAQTGVTLNAPPPYFEWRGHKNVLLGGTEHKSCATHHSLAGRVARSTASCRRAVWPSGCVRALARSLGVADQRAVASIATPSTLSEGERLGYNTYDSLKSIFRSLFHSLFCGGLHFKSLLNHLIRWQNNEFMIVGMKQSA